MKGHKCPHCAKAWRCFIRECKLDDYIACGDCAVHEIQNIGKEAGKIERATTVITPATPVPEHKTVKTTSKKI